jgi:predicted dehydrogenase
LTTTRKNRWGILGTGAIARTFTQGLALVPDAELVAVGSRNRETADRFADSFSIPNRHGSYEELALDPDVDVVYVATPHSLHYENMLLCLKAGKAVLCEKPFTINAREAEEVIATARAKRLFLMEAMWTRFLPLLHRLRALLEQGAIGEVRMLQADFGFRTSVNPKGRLFDPALGGGALLDVGVYLVSLASMALGVPSKMVSLAHLGETGVDEQAAIVLGYGGGQLAVLSTAIRTNTPQEATFLGTEGYIRIHAPWWRATRLTLERSGREPEVIEAPFPGNGYQYEAIDVGRCLAEGRLESSIMPLDETFAIMTTMDEVRRAWALRYPMEGKD